MCLLTGARSICSLSDYGGLKTMNLEETESQRHKVTMLNTPRPKVNKRVMRLKVWNWDKV